MESAALPSGHEPLDTQLIPPWFIEKKTKTRSSLRNYKITVDFYRIWLAAFDNLTYVAAVELKSKVPMSIFSWIQEN